MVASVKIHIPIHIHRIKCFSTRTASMALGFGPERAHTAVRLGISRFNTEEEIEFATDSIVSAVSRLRRIRTMR
jgi:cysteine sulfinate desulfinase/cysteine desulfurase-like protein